MLNKFIIIEGPDNTGKGTLIKNIKNYFTDITFHTLHYSNIKIDNIDQLKQYSKKMYSEMFELMYWVLRYNKSGIICDRSYLGELVYSPIYRNYSGDYVIDIEKQYSVFEDIWNNLYLIVLYDTPERLIQRDDGLSFSTELEKKKMEINLFIDAYNKSLIKNKLLLNIEINNEKQACKSAIEFLKNE